MKKYFLFACVAAALVSCSSDEFLGNENGLTQQAETGAILFQSTNMKATRADQKVGKDAATILGENFIVEGVKGAKNAAVNAMDVVFDNYLVAWGENTAGTSEDNTNDWKYVGVTETPNCPESVLSALQGVSAQTIKYWDYSQDAYNFVAYSTGALQMTTGTPTKGTSVGVTKINQGNAADPIASTDEVYTNYKFTAKQAADFAQCYYTDVTPVLKAKYNQPVTLTFKNLSAKVRIALYETVPGYAVKDVKFYQEDAANVPTDIKTATKTTNATLIGSKSFPEEGTITVSYPSTAATNNGTDNWNKADVLVAATTASTDPTYKEWGALEYKTNSEGTSLTEAKYLGTTLPTASFAGVKADNFYQYVIPTNGASDALTLRVDYTLESIDGSGETINVYGAKAVVPATYTAWKSNYAYTYVFKISDNTNGWTSDDPTDPEVKEGLFPITFDAVVEAVNDNVNNEQTTVTTVATPTVTSYQYGHVMNNDYAAGTEDIFVQVMDNSTVPATLKADLAAGNCKLYEVDDDVTEADVMSALNVQEKVVAGVITGRNEVELTPADATLNFATATTEIKFKDGTTTKPGAQKAAYFTPEAKNYAFVYDYTTGTPTASEIYTYVASAATAEPGDWGTANLWWVKNTDGSYSAAPTTWVAGTYYKRYIDTKRSYAVKVIIVK